MLSADVLQSCDISDPTGRRESPQGIRSDLTGKPALHQEYLTSPSPLPPLFRFPISHSSQPSFDTQLLPSFPRHLIRGTDLPRHTHCQPSLKTPHPLR
ncbi:hypothetical protein VTJ04DRAFT_3574 [Mycothermus thermophilus]|uniref:uncharacterized protein n=1 Tax=Humicola insolens TaxID=85995 RepID=UPI00374277F8